MYDIDTVRVNNEVRRAQLTRSWAQHRSIFTRLRGRRTQG